MFRDKPLEMAKMLQAHPMQSCFDSVTETLPIRSIFLFTRTETAIPTKRDSRWLNQVIPLASLVTSLGCHILRHPRHLTHVCKHMHHFGELKTKIPQVLGNSVHAHCNHEPLHVEIKWSGISRRLSQVALCTIKSVVKSSATVCVP